MGESFHVVSARALSLRGYAEKVSAWFGKEPRLTFKPWDEWKKGVSPEDADATWDHVAHSPCCSIEKARRMLGYEPRYHVPRGRARGRDALVERGIVRGPVTGRVRAAGLRPSGR